MRCGTSFYNGTLGKQLTLRFWPLIALYGVIWGMALPVQALATQVETYSSPSVLLQYLAESFRTMGPLLAMIFSGLVAMAVCSHLYTTRSANFTTALPPRRTALFFTHYLTGLVWLVVPMVLMSGLALSVYLTKAPEAAAQMWQVFGSGTGSYLLIVVFFYSMAVLCGMLTGQLIALPAFYVIFNGLVFGLWVLLSELISFFCYGFPGNTSSMPLAVQRLTPLAQFLSREHTLALSAPYALVGVAMALVSWLLYCKRPMERAGDVIAWAGLKPVFRYSVAICGGIALGVLTRSMLGLGELGVAVWVVLWAVASYFVAQMFLTKSVRVLRYWKGAAVVAVGFVLCFVAAYCDIFGYATRVPNPQQVASVTVSGLSSSPYDSASPIRNATVSDPETVSLVTKLHQTLVDTRPTNKSVGQGNSFTSQLLSLTYTLSDGTRLQRIYSFPIVQSGNQPAPPFNQLVEQLLNRPDLLLSAYQFDQIPTWEREGYTLSYSYTRVYDSTQEVTEDTPFTVKQARDLIQAVVKDIQAGNLPRSPWGDRDGYNLYFQWEKRGNTTNTPPHSINVCIPPQAVNTLAVLEPLLSHTEQ